MTVEPASAADVRQLLRDVGEIWAIVSRIDRRTREIARSLLDLRSGVVFAAHVGKDAALERMLEHLRERPESRLAFLGWCKCKFDGFDLGRDNGATRAYCAIVGDPARFGVTFEDSPTRRGGVK